METTISEVEDLKRQLADLRSLIEAQLPSARIQIGALASSVSTASTQLDGLRSLVESLSLSVDKANANVITSENRLGSKMEGMVWSLSAQVSAESRRLAFQEATMHAQYVKIADLIQRLEALPPTPTSSAGPSVTGLTSEDLQKVHELEQRMTELERRMRHTEGSSRIAELEEKLRGREDLLDRFEPRLTVETARVNDVERRMVQIESMIASKSHMTQMESRLAEIKRALTSITEQPDVNITNRLDQLEHLAQELKQSVQQLQNQVGHNQVSS